MFSIFQKKVYLVDLIGGITDFHNHILPGIDDGAKTVQDSTRLIKAFQNIGINSLIATPHVMGDYYPNTPKSITKAFEELKPHLDNSIKFEYSAEYMMDQHFLEIIEKDQIIPLKGKNVLVEMSYFQPPLNLNDILFKLQSNSFVPILAHPERYAYFHSNDLQKYKDLKSRGCRFQLNMLSLSGHYGIGIQKTAYQLLENRMIDFISSDVHRLGHIEKIEKIKVARKYKALLDRVIAGNHKLFE